jgi:hypothetical protein
MDYKKAFDPQNFSLLSVRKEPSMQYETKTEILNVYSGDRDISVFPNPSNYVMKLLDTTGNTFKNVKSIRLLSGVFPDINNLTQEPYLILHIQEFNSGMTGTNSNFKAGSTILQLDRPITPTYFLNLKTDICKCIYASFDTPLVELSKLTVKITDCLGNPFNFGTDSGTPNKSLQHMLSFEIITEIPKNTTMYRNVYT